MTGPRLDHFLLPDEVDDLIEPICQLAGMHTTVETRADNRDADLDALILAARRIRDREGFEVLEGEATQ